MDAGGAGIAAKTGKENYEGIVFGDGRRGIDPRRIDPESIDPQSIDRHRVDRHSAATGIESVGRYEC